MKYFTLFLILIATALLIFNATKVDYNAPLQGDSIIALIDQEIDRKDSFESLKIDSENALNNYDSIHFYDFDPNDFPAERWQDFGLTEKQVAVIKRYESSGGNFRSKKDVKKMFRV